MLRKYNPTWRVAPRKTVGPRAAALLMGLGERGKRIVSLKEVQSLTGLSENSVRQFADKLVARGLLARLRPGLFIAVPFELGREREYLGNQYVVGRELVRGVEYYISYASAMDIHQMTTQPQLVVYVSTPKAIRSRNILGTEFRFVSCKPKNLFGLTTHWVDKTEQVVVSDLERTVIDGLRRPAYCGGLTEVAKGLWMRRDDMEVRKLVDYAVELDSGAVTRRLGWLLETLGFKAGEQLERLRARVTAFYVLADPALPSDGPYYSRWRIRLNVSPEEVRAGLGT